MIWEYGCRSKAKSLIGLPNVGYKKIQFKRGHYLIFLKHEQIIIIGSFFRDKVHLFTMKQFYIMFLVCCIQCNNVKPNLNQNKIESRNVSAKNGDIFVQIDFPNEMNNISIISFECLNELQKVKYSLQNSQIWALKRKYDQWSLWDF